MPVCASAAAGLDDGAPLERSQVPDTGGVDLTEGPPLFSSEGAQVADGFKELNRRERKPDRHHCCANAVDLFAGNPPWLLPVIASVLALIQLGLIWCGLPAALHGDVDFKAFYTAGHLIAQGRGHELYSYRAQQQMQQALFGGGAQTLPFLYPAYAGLLFVPWSLLPYRAAYLLFSAVNLAALALSCSVICSGSPLLRRLPLSMRLVLIAALLPIAEVVIQGQISLLLLLLYCILQRLLLKQKSFRAGLVLAACLVKFQIAIPIAVLFLAWRCLRVLAGFISGAMALGLISFAIGGSTALSGYWQSTCGIVSATLSHPVAAKARYGMYAGDMPNLHGMLFVATHGSRSSGVVLALASAAILLWAARQRPSLMVALPAALLVSYHLQVYDLVLLLLPMALTAERLLEPAHASQTAVELQHDSVPRESESANWPHLCALFASLVLISIPVAPWLLVHSLAPVCGFAIVGVMIAGTLVLRAPTSQEKRKTGSPLGLDLRESRR